jgi:hypothetical protein
VLVVVAIVVGIFLMNKGGGGAVVASAGDRLPATTTTTSLPPGAVTQTTQTSATLPPASVRIVAANGTTVKGLAAKTKTTLAAAGYTNVAALSTSTPVTSSLIYYVPGADADARAVAKAVGFSVDRVAALPPASQIPVTPITGARVILLLGPDAPGASSAPTTLATQATTTTVKK